MDPSVANFLTLFGFGIMGIIASIIASRKNRSEWGWYIAGFLFGIFGIILIAILPKFEEGDRRYKPPKLWKNLWNKHRR